MLGTDGSKGETLVKVTWEQFQTWQRWDEYPERRENPPMTVDMLFWYRERKYFLDYFNCKYAILTENWEIIAADANFLSLLTKPIELFGNKSFRAVIEELLFED